MGDDDDDDDDDLSTRTSRLFIWSSCKDPEWLSLHVFIIHWLGLLGLLKPRLTVLVMMTTIDYY